MRKLIACVASAALVLILPLIVNAAWQQVQLGDGTTVCKDDVTGAEFKPCDENTATSFLSWVLNSAVAATIRTRTLTNSDGTQDTTYPADSKPPSSSTFTWACDASLAVIANQNTGTATNINIDSCASGSGVSSATYSFVKASDLTNCSTDWTITGTYPNRLLHNAGSNTGSGTCRLKAVVSSSTTLSATAYPWAYTTAVSDTTAPNPVTGLTCTAASTTTITCTFDSTVDPADGVSATGVKTYHFQRNGSALTGQDLTAVSSGMVDDFTGTAIGTASGTASITLGTKCALSGNGGAGIEGAADNYNACTMQVNGSTHDIITRVSALPNVGPYNKAMLQFTASLSPDSIANDCDIINIGGTFYTSSRNRHTTAGSRQSSGQQATAISATLPIYLHAHYDTSGLDCDYSSDGGAWTNYVTDFAAAPVGSGAKYATIGTTATQVATSISTTFDFITVNNVGRLTKTLTVPAGASATYTVTAEDNAGNVSTALAGWTGSPSTPTSSTIKFEPGWYVEYSAKCIPYDGVRYGCQTSEILSFISSEICADSNIVGLKILAYPSFVIPNSASSGNYTGGTNQGFTAFDSIVNALNACSKHLILEVDYGEFSGPDAASSFYPTFTFPSSCTAPLNCTGGTAIGGAYGLSLSTQASQPGQMANIWQSDWRLLAKAALTAYCNRYDSNPAFYGVAMFYTNLSLPIDPHNLPAGYSLGAFHTQYLTYLDEARSVCPTTNILDVADFTDPYPAQISTHFAKLATMHGTIANNDVSVNEPSYGQVIYSGVAGSPTIIDYRGVVRYMEEVQSPDMCGYVNGGVTPAQLFDVMQNGNAAQRARWPSHIIVQRAPECDGFPTQGYAAWKTFIASKSGMVMNARDSTLRTVAAIKSSWCETSMGGCP